MAETQKPEVKTHSLDPKDRLLGFSTDLFGKLADEQRVMTEEKKGFSSQTVLTLKDGREVGLVNEVSNDPDHPEDPSLLTLVIRQPHSRSGEMTQYKYGINVDAVMARANHEPVKEEDLLVIMNTPAREELQPALSSESRTGEVAMRSAITELAKAFLINAAAEVVVSTTLDEIGHYPTDEWHADWNVDVANILA